MNDVELDQLLNVWEAPMPSPALRRTTLAAFPRDWRWKIGGLPVRWLAAAALGAGTLAVGTSLWSDPELGYQFQGSVDGDSSLYMRLSRRIDPPSAKIRWLLKGGGSSIRDTPAGGIAGMSYLRDRSAGRFYGFKYDVEPTGNGYYQVTFAPTRRIRPCSTLPGARKFV